MYCVYFGFGFFVPPRSCWFLFCLSMLFKYSIMLSVTYGEIMERGWVENGVIKLKALEGVRRRSLEMLQIRSITF